MSKTMPMQPAGGPVKPWYRHKWPWLLMAGPGIVAVAATYTGWLAFSRQDALVVGDYYTQGKAINQDLRRDRVATTLGLTLALRYDVARAILSGKIESHGKPYSVPLLLHLAHATVPEKDIKLMVQPDAEGKFSAPLPMFERTRWQVQAENVQRAWRLDGVWIWPSQRDIEMRADPGKADPAE